eukprot:scaffold12312_cov63-Phaeocystis_antarctica.AAC.15
MSHARGKAGGRSGYMCLQAGGTRHAVGVRDALGAHVAAHAHLLALDEVARAAAVDPLHLANLVVAEWRVEAHGHARSAGGVELAARAPVLGVLLPHV